MTYKVLYNASYTGSITIPEAVTYDEVTYSVTSIGWGAFNECIGMASVTIGNSVNSIGRYAFNNCKKVDNVYCYAEKFPTTEIDAFKGVDTEHATLYVPDSSIDAYKTSGPWQDFGTIKALSDVSGDVNTNGTVDISDVNAIISDICGMTSNPKADINLDGTVDISDVNKVISVICGAE